MTDFGKDRSNNFASSAAPKRPASDPIDVSKMFTVYSSKYDVTYYGKTKKQAEANMLADDIKRGGERISKKGKLNRTIKG